MQKPEKIYLHYPNLHYALSGNNSDIGNRRESFFANQVSVVKNVTYAEQGDFKVDAFVYEVGGKDKDFKAGKTFGECVCRC